MSPADYDPRTFSYIEVVQLPFRIGAPEGRAVRLDAGARGVEVWHERTKNGVDGYTVFAGDRTYLVLVYPGSGHPTQDAVLKMIRSVRP
ncbi:MAG: hypothetical protein ACR2HN_08715 [Tepidiformaceae bacterium]